MIYSVTIKTNEGNETTRVCSKLDVGLLRALESHVDNNVEKVVTTLARSMCQFEMENRSSLPLAESQLISAAHEYLEQRSARINAEALEGNHG